MLAMTPQPVGDTHTKPGSGYNGIRIVAGPDLEETIKQYPCSLAEVEIMEQSRCKTMRDVEKEIAVWKRC
jgi:hypothetical protein